MYLKILFFKALIIKPTVLLYGYVKQVAELNFLRPRADITVTDFWGIMTTARPKN